MARCCLCHKRVQRTIVEMRHTGTGGRQQAWTYCRPCWDEILRQKEYLATEPLHRQSPLIAGAPLTLIHVKAFHQENIA